MMRFVLGGAEAKVAGVIVETHKLSKQYGQLAALAECTLSIESGEVFGLLGPNGAGKTTLIRILMGFLRPTAGWARVAGHDCERQSLAVRREVAYLPADGSLFPSMRGTEALRFFAEIRTGGNLERSLAIAQLLDLDLSRRVSFMSTGMKQKLALAATLAAPTPIYILDEPTANLDPTVRSTVLALVAEAKAAGKTVIFSSHVLSEVEEVCDRVVILRSGRLVHTQPMDQLRTQHRIAAVLAGPLPAIPPAFQDQLFVIRRTDREIVLETPGELAPLLKWLGSLPITDVRIEPVGLRAVYDRFHGERPRPLAEARHQPAAATSPAVPESVA
jgi:ABC-2 type transport system ATP-binding protein